MIHPDTEIRFINQEIGFGVFATKFIPQGTMVYVKDHFEMVVSPSSYKQLKEPLKSTVEKYSYIDEHGDRIVSWDHAKYVNHCCQCNTMSTGYGFEIAIRDIEAGEEITDEYGMFNLEYTMPLNCDKPGCRRQVSSRDLAKYFSNWDALVKKALRKFQKVEQPLLPLMETAIVDAVTAFLKDEANYVSVKGLMNQSKKHVAFSENGISSPS